MEKGKYECNDGSFDYETWSDDLVKWFKNKELLKFNIKVIKDGSNLKVKTDVEEKYRKSLISLTMDIIKGALYWLSFSYAFESIPKDKEKLEFKRSEEMSDKVEMYMNVLFNFGENAFFSLLEYYATGLRLQYELETLENNNGQWCKWNGNVWNNGHWDIKEADGSISSGYVPDIYKEVLPYNKKQAKA